MNLTSPLQSRGSRLIYRNWVRGYDTALCQSTPSFSQTFELFLFYRSSNILVTRLYIFIPRDTVNNFPLPKIFATQNILITSLFLPPIMVNTSTLSVKHWYLAKCQLSLCKCSFLLKIREHISMAVSPSFVLINNSNQRAFPRFRFSPHQCKWGVLGAFSVNAVWVKGDGGVGL